MPREEGRPEGAAAALVDELVGRPTTASEVVFSGAIFDVRRDRVDLGDAGQVTREVVEHPGAVIVLALDEEDRLVMIQQYRHPIRAREWELPAGILDVPGEAAVDAARRELAEEVDLEASTWHTLVDYVSSPGSLSEALRVFVARDLSLVAEGSRHAREGEEADMPVAWVSLDDARQAVLDGSVHNAGAVIGILTAHASREGGWRSLRPADDPWTSHPRTHE